MRIDDAANAGASPDADVSAPDSSVRVLVLEAREELAIAREARRFLSGDSAVLVSPR